MADALADALKPFTGRRGTLAEMSGLFVQIRMNAFGNWPPKTWAKGLLDEALARGLLVEDGGTYVVMT